MARPKNTVQSDNPTQVKILEQEITRLQKELEEPLDTRMIDLQEKCKRLMDRLDITRDVLNIAKQLIDVKDKRFGAKGIAVTELREKDMELSLRYKEALTKAGF